MREDVLRGVPEQQTPWGLGPLLHCWMRHRIFSALLPAPSKFPTLVVLLCLTTLACIQYFDAISCIRNDTQARHKKEKINNGKDQNGIFCLLWQHQKKCRNKPGGNSADDARRPNYSFATPLFFTLTFWRCRLSIDLFLFYDIYLSFTCLHLKMKCVL